MKIFGKYLIIVLFLLLVIKTEAGLEITEINYAPVNGADYEWVEIFNNGTDSIDLDKYRFFHGENNSGPITLRNGVDKILKPSQYLIIARSLTDYSWLNFTGAIFSASVLSLPDKFGNTYIAISNKEKKIIDSVIYNPSSGGSKTSKSSLSKINGAWISGIPTPGYANKEMKVINPVTIKNKKETDIVNLIDVPTGDTSENKEQEIINLNNFPSDDFNIYNPIYPFLALFVLIGLGIISFLIVKKRYSNNDYLENKIRPEDITIIE